MLVFTKCMKDHFEDIFDFLCISVKTDLVMKSIKAKFCPVSSNMVCG